MAAFAVDPSLDPTMTIVLPTIAACILLVFFMILGIQKCNEWELDRIATLRRTRRLMERITVVLREKNIRLIQSIFSDFLSDLRKWAQYTD